MEEQVIDPKMIRGWGMDEDRRNNPTYPMKKNNGDDHERSNWKRPYLQYTRSEILKSTERPHLSAVFGTRIPPKGISGMLRRKAYKSSENMFRHWFLLILADRVDIVSGSIRDLFRFRFALFSNDRGWRALAKYKPGLFAWKIAQRLIILTIIALGIFYFI
jgi:hypothetical protein